jgi:hypothetical protein
MAARRPRSRERARSAGRATVDRRHTREAGRRAGRVRPGRECRPWGGADRHRAGPDLPRPGVGRPR